MISRNWRSAVLLAAGWLLVFGAGCDSDGPAPQSAADTAATDAAIDSASTADTTAADVGTEDTAPELDATTDDAEADADAADDALDDAPPEDLADLTDTPSEDMVDEPFIKPDGLPDELPFEFTREAVGTAPTETEITDFTRAVTGFWRDVDYWRWVRMTSHGVDPTFDEDMPDYALWWQDTQAIRDGDDVIFRHTGRADNLTLRTCKVLTNAIAGYLMTGDEDMRWIVEQYSKGIAALAMGMEFEEDDPYPYIQARALFTRNHEYDTVGGRHVIIDYDPVRRDEEAWNASIIHNPTNPYWGDIWLVNQRSKDDVPHMFRVVPMLMRAAEEAPDQSVRDAAELALEYLRGFSVDIVESGYLIRTRFDGSEPAAPRNEQGYVKDLASFVSWDNLDPNAECIDKVGAALIGYGEPLENDCGSGHLGQIEDYGTIVNYFNYAIIRTFHIAAVHNAIMAHEYVAAEAMMEGLVERFDRMMYDETMPNRDYNIWWADTAVFLVSAAAAGYPLTADEAQVVQEQFLLSVEQYESFEGWDPWAVDFPQGAFNYKPERGVAVRITEMGYLLEYCYSPLRNPAGVQFVDCDVVADMDRWGE